MAEGISGSPIAANSFSGVEITRLIEIHRLPARKQAALESDC